MTIPGASSAPSPAETDPATRLIRPLGAIWLGHLENALDEVLGEEGQWHILPLPGITYVGVPEFDSLAADARQKGVPDFAKRADKLVETVVNHGPAQLATAAQGVRLPINELRVNIRPHRPIELAVRLDDKPSEAHGGGFQIRGEKQAFRNSLGLPVKPPQNEARSRMIVQIGDIDFVPRDINRGTIGTRLAARVPGHIILGHLMPARQPRPTKR
jgi:hypothetical protein